MLAIFEHEGVTLWREPDQIRLVDLHSKAAEFAQTITSDDDRLWSKYKGMADSIHRKALRAFYIWEANGRQVL